MEENITIVVVEPGSQPYAKQIPQTLEAMQEIVGGLIQLVPLEGRVWLTCNEEGKLLRLTRNRRVGGDDIVGTFFITKLGDEGDNISLTDQEQNRWIRHFMIEGANND